MNTENRGLAWGLLGVLIFSATMPLTRMAVGTPEAPLLDPWFVAFGRSAVAGVLACCVLLYWIRKTGLKTPDARQFRLLAVTAGGIVFGFPILTTVALRYVNSAHAAVIAGILPLATASFGALLNRERPSGGFWVCAVAGACLVVSFAVWRGAGALHAADWLLFLAMLAAPLGYAVGAQLSRPVEGLGGGPMVICWVLAISLPLSLIGTALSLTARPIEQAVITPAAWSGFAYVSVMSMFLGFFAWYKGLALGGVARVSQVQLVQPFCTIMLGTLLLNETLELVVMIFAVAVLALVGLSRTMPIRRAG